MTEARAWFCIRTQSKHEHIAAAHLNQAGIETFLPRIRFQRPTKRGAQWFSEALFPSYLFARFLWQQDLRRVRHSRGVKGVVHFGDRWPCIPEAQIAELKALVGSEQIRVVQWALRPGERVDIVAGPFHGLRAVVQEYHPAAERVRVLLDFLGRQTSVQLSAEDVLGSGEPRKAVVDGKRP